MTNRTPRSKSDEDPEADAAIRDAYAAAAGEELAAQAGRVRRAKQTARREQAKLDRMTAEAVSATPTAITWYAHPGLLDLTTAAAKTGGNELSVHRAVERHRTARARTARR